MDKMKLCTRCYKAYPLTREFFYPAFKLDRKSPSWQSYCKPCWKDINFANKQRRKELVKNNDLTTFFKIHV